MTDWKKTIAEARDENDYIPTVTILGWIETLKAQLDQVSGALVDAGSVRVNADNLAQGVRDLKGERDEAKEMLREALEDNTKLTRRGADREKENTRLRDALGKILEQALKLEPLNGVPMKRIAEIAEKALPDLG